jgi:hypothetical protein
MVAMWACPSHAQAVPLPKSSTILRGEKFYETILDTIDSAAFLGFH